MHGSNLEGYNTGSGGGLGFSRPGRFQLAEHRYGREEMLALYDRSGLPSEPLISLSNLYVEKKQMPLALVTPTEDEQVRQFYNYIFFVD